VENAEDAATWKATISMLRRQLILPLLEEVVARGEEGNISIVRILCVATQQLYSTGSVQEAGVKQPVAKGNYSCRTNTVVRGGLLFGGLRSRNDGRCVFNNT
jgi:hypothetical protein